MDKAEEFKENGNLLFKQKKYKESFNEYNNALDILDNSINNNKIKSILYSNQSACCFQLKNYKDSEKYARLSISYDNRFIKSYYRLVQSLYNQYKLNKIKLDLLKQSKLILLDIIQENKNILNDNILYPYVNLYRKLEQEHIEVYYNNNLLSNENINIIYNSDSISYKNWFKLLKNDKHNDSYVGYCTNNDKGKGVFAKKDFNIGEVIIIEEPICQHIKTNCLSLNDNNNTCSYCLHTILSKHVFKSKFDNYKQLYNEIYTSTTIYTCNNCNEQYCSELCKNSAWNTYHKFLCNNSNNIKDDLYNLAKKEKKTNPLLIARMFAIVLSLFNIQNYNKDNINERFIDLGPFEFFECQGIESLNDIKYLKMINQIILPNAIQYNIPEKYINSLLTITIYRKFYAMIQRNAQELYPVSDFHMYLASLSDTKRYNICQQIDNTINISDLNIFMQENKFLQSLCTITATSMLHIGNCMNHSCYPNVIAASGHNNHKLQFIACRNIKKGEELYRSYINEDLPKKQRQILLKEKYGFLCLCSLCKQT